MTLEEIYNEFRASSGVSTDTRTIGGNFLYFALKGERYDGNQFVEEALQKGCRLVVADDPLRAQNEKVCIVEDALQTLQDLARHHRRKWNGNILAITGSNGKTTTKELVASILSGKYSVCATSGNLNNHIGVPLTLLRLKTEEIAVVEMGANHPGEIRRLCEIAEPDTGIITNIGKAHLEGFGSIEGVMKAKGELYDYLEKNGKTAIVDLSSPELRQMVKSRKMKMYTYGTGGDFNVTGEQTASGDGISGRIIYGTTELTFHSGIYGGYNFQNILAAAATGFYFSVNRTQIIKGIAAYRPENNRSQILEGRTNRIVLDAYNANPTSMEQALLELEKSAHERKMVILGDMLELGSESLKEHEKILQLLTGSRLNKVILVGEIFYNFSQDQRYPFTYFNSMEECMKYLGELRPRNMLILLKGSRKNALEQSTNLLNDC